MRNDVLVCEISGKRPGTTQARKTERFNVSYPHCIISNDSNGYESEWEIVNVPDDYAEWYKSTVKNSDSAWYAPMNRSYAIKYAKEHGYKYLVQLDDNINFLELAYQDKRKDKIVRRYRVHETQNMLDDFVNILVTILENTNAGMAGCNLAACSNPDMTFMSERYVYSFFALNLEICPPVFHGDFEDDIEYRLKCWQMGVPSIQVACLRYSKTGQAKNKDLTGCRKAYAAAGVKRGEHMRRLYGDKYKCGMRSRGQNITAQNEPGEQWFKHILKPFKVGVLVKNKKAIDAAIAEAFRKYAKPNPDKVLVKTKKVKKSGEKSGSTEKRD